MNVDKIQLTKEEVQQFEVIEEKKNALYNLVFICEDNELLRNEELYNRFLFDVSKTEKDRIQLWKQVMEKYNIQNDENHELELDYQTSTITRVPKS